jgi:TctA family transporter
MSIKRWIVRSAVTGVLAGAAIFPVMGSAQATGVSCQVMEQRYDELMKLYRDNDSLGFQWATFDPVTANYYWGLADFYHSSAQTYLNMRNVQEC